MHEPDDGSPLCRVYLMGSFRIEWLVPSCDEHAWNSRTSGLALFKLLLCAPGRQAPKTTLAGTLWPESDEEKALESLRAALKVLRRVLSTQQGIALIEHHAQGEALKLAGQEQLWLDIDAFSDLLAQGSEATTSEEARRSWEQAHALLSGDLLADDQRHEWSRCRWVKLRQQTLWVERCRLVRRLADLYLDQGETERAEAFLEAHVVRFPSDQDALARLLKLLLAHDSIHEALVLYERAQRALAANGVRPNKYLSQLGEQLLQRLEPPDERPLSSPAQPAQQIAPPTMPALLSQPGSPKPDLLSALALFVQAHGQGISQNGAGQANGHHSAATRLFPLHTLDHLVISLGTSSDGTAPGAWIAQAAGPLGALFEQGWSIDTLLEVLQVILPVIKAMPTITRHTFLQAGATAMPGGLPRLDSKRISEEEIAQFCQAFSESISAGWKLFTLGKNAQALAVSQALLALLHYISPALPVQERPALYASVYNFLGMTLCHEGRYHEALQAHTNGYIAASGTGNALGVVYSLLGRTNTQYNLGQGKTAIETMQQAQLTLGALGEQQPAHTRAHLFGTWADSAMTTGDYETAREKLDTIATLLDGMSPNETFDSASWYQLSGKYAGLTGDYATAARYCEQSWQELSEASIVRRALALMPLLAATACMRDLDASLIALEKARQIIPVLHTPIMKQPLQQVLQQGFLVVFPHEANVKTIVSELMQYLH
jgi:DNA-binding SARP family transcriptional activator